MALRYVDPDDAVATCHNSKIASGWIEVTGPDGDVWRVEADRSAALEILDRSDNHGFLAAC